MDLFESVLPPNFREKNTNELKTGADPELSKK